MVDSTIFSGLGDSSFYSSLANSLGLSVNFIVILFSLISIWSLVWTGLALWKSSKKNHLIWFIVLLVFNTLGILEILYIFVFSKLSKKNKLKIEAETKKNLGKEKKKIIVKKVKKKK